MNMDGSEPLEQDDVIDSRDVIARIDYLESRRDDEEQEEPLTEEEEQELSELLALQSEAESAADWTYGETLIRDSYFEDYARQLAEDIGAIDPNANWPLNCIDWEEAASQLQQDYFSVEWSGETYWIR